MPRLAFFEDDEVRHLRPLVDLRPVYDLRAGILSLRHRIELDLGRRADRLLSRDRVAGLIYSDDSDSVDQPRLEALGDATLFINGRLLWVEAEILNGWRSLLEGALQSDARRWLRDGDTVAAWCPAGFDIEMSAGIPNFDRIDSVEIDSATLLRRLSDLTSSVAKFIADDASAIGIRGVSDEASVSVEATLSGSHFMAVGPGAIVEPGAILYSEEGPVIIEKDAQIMAGAIVRGPCHIGANARVKMGARISASSIGEGCRVGGEMSNSLMLSFANKGHDGYVGNSYIGAWCNLGADTNTSNLRNDYGEVTLYNEELGAFEATGQQFVGLIMGDHSRSGINTMFNTATLVGLACNVFGAGYQPRYIPSFSWGGKDRLMAQRPERVFPSIAAMMSRRGRVLTDVERAALIAVFEDRRGVQTR